MFADALFHTETGIVKTVQSRGLPKNGLSVVITEDFMHWDTKVLLADTWTSESRSQNRGIGGIMGYKWAVAFILGPCDAKALGEGCLVARAAHRPRHRRVDGRV